MLNLHACIAYPCTDERSPGSAFCEKHLIEHLKSAFHKDMVKKGKGR